MAKAECKSCSWSADHGIPIDTRMSNVEWAKLIGVKESSIRRHRAHAVTEAPMRELGLSEYDQGVRVLKLDIETRPAMGYIWALWDQNVSIGQLKENSEMICFGASWLGSDEVIVKTVFHDGKDAMLAELWSLVNEADAIMGWNSKGFDSKHIKREFIQAGMRPPSPWKELDLMLAWKANFKTLSNKLDYVSQYLGVGHKVKHEGFDLWLKCMAGDVDAWDRMVEYQIQDVVLLDDLYYKMLPWLSATYLPNMAIATGNLDGCINCAGRNLQKRGLAATSTGTFQRYVCLDCGKWQKATRRVATSDMRQL